MNYKFSHPILNQLLAILAGILVIWLTIRMVRYNPQVFNRESISRSFFTIGVLTLFLIGFIALCVWLLRHFT